MITPALASIIGTTIATAGSFAGGMYQNYKQEQFYNNYMSPQARMSQMTEAGINPSAAAQGISGSSAPQMSAAGPSGALSGLGDMVSAIPQLTAEIENIKSQAFKNKSEAEYYDSLKVGQDIANGYSPQQYEATIAKLKEEGRLTGYQADQLAPYAKDADKFAQINFEKLDNEAKKLKKEVDEIDEKIKNLGKERDVMESQIGKNEADAGEANARAALERQKKEIIDSLGGEDVETAYTKALVEGDTEKAEAIKNGVQAFKEAESKGTAQGNLSVTAGHDGVVGKTLDVITRFSGLRYNSNLMDVLSGFGITFDAKNMPHFRPIDKLWNMATRPSYSDWRHQQLNKINEAYADLNNQYSAGRITKAEYKKTRQQLDVLKGSGLTEQAYKETFGIKK